MNFHGVFRTIDKSLACLSIALACVVGFLVMAGCSRAQDSDTSPLHQSMGESVDTSLYAQTDPSTRLSFPDDHSSHDDFLMEWWYVTSVLHTSSGTEIGVQFTIFRRSLSPSKPTQHPWRTGQVYLAHAAVSDVRAKRHYDAERISRAHPQLAGVVEEPFHAHVDGWSLFSSEETFFPLRVAVKSRDFIIDLTLEETKPIVLHGDEGYSRKSPENASHYYSIPRMKTQGAVRIGSKTHAVSGLSWMDREWSSSMLSRQYEGWYWFAISFEDGRDLVLFSLRDKLPESDENRVAMWVDVDGEPRTVDRNQWSIEPVRNWKQWPVEWLLSIEGDQLAISAAFDNQEMNTSIPYWEGVVHATSEGTRRGSGYMELTGYSP